jgi:ubiquinone/menaquinone biosynthesis C-methylase UbiE
MSLIIVVASAVLIAVLAYWLIVLSEGVYLGQRVVVWLYDRGAESYDRVKDFDEDDEADYLGRPLLERLRDRRAPAVLDVATGTGRAPLALLTQPGFDGRIVGVDLAAAMLAQAAEKLRDFGDRVSLRQADACDLPFADELFDVVMCIEALEFFPNPPRALREMVRVLSPGGLLLVTARVGRDRLYLPGRARGADALVGELRALGMTDIEVQVWQTYYSLVWSVKASTTGPDSAP